MDGSKPSSPTSVFSFHRKPRSPETTTTTATVPTQQEREAIILEAKRHIRDIVRNDWDYETSLTNSPPSADSNASSTTATTPSSSAPTTITNSTTTTTATATTSSSKAETGPLSDVVGWRLREYDSSGSEFDPEQAGPAQAARQQRRNEQNKDSDAAVRTNFVERRRRRRRQLEEEMRWNIGLRIWVERRNAWSGARTRADVKRTSGAQAAPSAAQVDQKIAENAPLVRPLSSESAGSRSTVPAEGEGQGDQASQPSSDGSSLVPETEALSVTENHDAASKEGETSVLETTEEGQSTGEEKEDNEEDDPNEPLVPLVRPLLPESNPIRSSIKPSLYPSIYSKIVVQGLTPTVPINLADVTRAMVEGWKADGQWPPKPTPQAPGDNIVTRRRANAANNTGPNNDEKRKSHGGVAGAMKKVLGFSGIHHYPFHRRGSSQGTGGDGANDVPLVEENPSTQNT